MRAVPSLVLSAALIVSTAGVAHAGGRAEPADGFGAGAVVLEPDGAGVFDQYLDDAGNIHVLAARPDAFEMFTVSPGGQVLAKAVSPNVGSAYQAGGAFSGPGAITSQLVGDDWVVRRYDVNAQQDLSFAGGAGELRLSPASLGMSSRSPIGRVYAAANGIAVVFNNGDSSQRTALMLTPDGQIDTGWADAGGSGRLSIDSIDVTGISLGSSGLVVPSSNQQVKVYQRSGGATVRAYAPLTTVVGTRLYDDGSLLVSGDGFVQYDSTGTVTASLQGCRGSVPRGDGGLVGLGSDGQFGRTCAATPGGTSTDFSATLGDWDSYFPYNFYAPLMPILSNGVVYAAANAEHKSTQRRSVLLFGYGYQGPVPATAVTDLNPVAMQPGYNSNVTWAGKIRRARNGALVLAPVHLQWRRTASTAWQTVKTWAPTSSSIIRDGFRFTAPADRAGQLRLVSVGDDQQAYGVSATYNVTPRGALSIRPSASTVGRGKPVRIYGASKPGGRITLQRLVGSAWRSVAAVNSTGAYTFTTTQSVAGTYRYRTVRSATSLMPAQTSVALAIRYS